MSTGPYRERILAHHKAPHNRGPLDPCDVEATCHNPLCGDRVKIQLRLNEDEITAAGFEARGCAIAIAAASMLTVKVHRLGREQAVALAERVVTAVQAGATDAGFDADLLALAEIHAHRSRRRCATLAWEALQRALAPRAVSDTGDTGVGESRH